MPTASYLSDALGDLVRAVRALCAGAEATRAAWEEEPGEFRWVLQRNDTEARVQLLAFADVYGDAPDESGQVVFDATCTVRDLGLAVASGAQRVLDELGADAYADKWLEHPFPADDLDALRASLDTDLP
jgi:hypothetical protein